MGGAAERVVGLRLPDADRCRLAQGTAYWDTAIRIFPSTD
jgi:hypothetical protein